MVGRETARYCLMIPWMLSICSQVGHHKRSGWDAPLLPLHSFRFSDAVWEEASWLQKMTRQSSLAECARESEKGNVIATRSNFPLKLFSNPLLSRVSFDWLHIVKCGQLKYLDPSALLDQMFSSLPGHYCLFQMVATRPLNGMCSCLNNYCYSISQNPLHFTCLRMV